MANLLRTQADGRLFAIDLIDKISEYHRQDVQACPFDPDAVEDDAVSPPMLYRKGAQWDGVFKELEHLYGVGNIEARKGFACVLTDLLAGDNQLPDYYADYERRGMLQDFGELGYKAKGAPPMSTLPRRESARADDKFQQFIRRVASS